MSIAVGVRQLISVAQLAGALQRNRRAAGRSGFGWVQYLLIIFEMNVEMHSTRQSPSQFHAIRCFKFCARVHLHVQRFIHERYQLQHVTKIDRHMSL